MTVSVYKATISGILFKADPETGAYTIGFRTLDSLEGGPRGSRVSRGTLFHRLQDDWEGYEYVMPHDFLK